MQDLHDGLVAVDKNKNFATANIAVHGIGDNTAKGVKAFSHVHRGGIQVIFKRFVKMEHATNQIDGLVHEDDPGPDPVLYADGCHSDKPIQAMPDPHPSQGNYLTVLDWCQAYQVML